MTARGRRPSIFQLGLVEDHGTHLVIRGWGLGLCAAKCACHTDPVGGGLTLYQDQPGQQLGLFHHQPADCDCCEPWTAAELAAILRDLTIVTRLDTVA